MEVDKLTEQVIGLAIEVHRRLGPGLLESAYQECLYYELKNANLKVEREKKLPIEYKKIKWNELKCRRNLLRQLQNGREK